MLKITIVGGGSSYTPEIIEGFIKRYNELPITHIDLFDIEEGRYKVETVGALAKRMIKKSGLDIELNISFNRRASLSGASFVCSQMRVGMIPARIEDELLGHRYGMIGQETNGIGGFAKAMRTIPVTLDLCRDIEDICPDAWLINFTNPSGIITEAVLKHTNVKVIGLCNVPVITQYGIEELLGKNIQVQFAGLNHFIHAFHVWDNGKDRIKELLEKMCQGEDFELPKNLGKVEWVPEQLMQLGALPCGYHQYYYKQDDAELKELKCENYITRGEEVQAIETELFKLYEDLNLDVKPKQLEERGGTYYSDAACELISAIYNDKRTLMHVNVRNNGTISELPNDCAIEATSVITSCGAMPLNLEPIVNPAIRGTLQLQKAFEELTVKAGVTGDYATALQALTINPLVRKGTVTKEILDDMLEINSKYLPQFKHSAIR
ncbi:putative 6-phospho-beta-glucosidase [Vibrio ruber DSM 16370]|uniref:Putative 6-phospho-beta-glucosidase n=1 Tax=Vibrio ruber (strain DSM 16370 / JCM 11486 / BCRC 17186 / CECT 7878 / LMG 23124 / VR1) TaxID=1123498 RepID=A0A1R4LNE4_VIBR1|nr:6-phospho-beta-glucosidase [Vibrio ruber]SJN57867.1 putative 6-phospho-beta-glucosidase [Vibrio ruber DSM 16370]